MKTAKMSFMNRRKFLRNTAGFAAMTILSGDLSAKMIGGFKPGKRLTHLAPSDVVPIGVIAPFSFRGLPGSAENILQYLLQLGMRTVELMNAPIEQFAGAPARPPFEYQRGAQLTPEQQAEMQATRAKYAEDLHIWRMSAPMEKYSELRHMYEDAGVEIRLVKFDTFTDSTSSEEIDYCFNTAKALGARAMTTGLSADKARILGPYADKHRFRVGLHNQEHIDPGEFDKLMTYGNYLGLNFDLGHHVAGSDIPLTDIIERYQDRMVSLHLTDRKKDNSTLPFGEGDTPLLDVLRFCASRKYDFGADIDLEYRIPEGSDALKEVGRCRDYCMQAFV